MPAAAEPLLSVVIPAYNEEGRLARTLTETLAYLALQPYPSEVFVVDDGSKDRTSDIVEELAALSNGRVRLLTNPGNRGKGFAVRHGAMNARGKVVLFFDADLSTPLEEIPKVLDPILDDRCDVAIGSRQVSQRRTQSPLRRAMGQAFIHLRKRLLGLGFEDTQCGFKALSRDAAHAVFGSQQIEGFAFDVELLVLAREQGWRVQEIPVVWVHQDGSKVRPVASALSMLKEMVEIRRQVSGRRHRRQASHAAVRVVASDGTASDGFMRNISQSGLFVTGTRMLPLDSRVTILLPEPDGSLLPLYGRVARLSTSDEPGLGIEFSGLPLETQRALGTFLKRL